MVYLWQYLQLLELRGKPPGNFIKAIEITETIAKTILRTVRTKALLRRKKISRSPCSGMGNSQNGRHCTEMRAVEPPYNKNIGPV